MYLDSLEFLEEERDAWAPFEALAALTDEQLATPVAGAHGWSGRQLMTHLLAWQEVALTVATELAVNETSPAFARSLADQEGRGIDAINADMVEAGASRSIEEIRDRFRTLPGELRGYLTVVPESRWLKHPRHFRSFQDDMTGHYEEHQSDLAAVLAAARG